jgi:hypothetical protein
VLGEPEAPISALLGVPSQIRGVAQGDRGVTPFGDGRQIEHGESGH